MKETSKLDIMRIPIIKIHYINKENIHLYLPIKESVHPGLMPVSDFEQTNYQIVNENDMHVRDSQGNNMTYEDMYKKAREQTNNSFSSMTNQENANNTVIIKVLKNGMNKQNHTNMNIHHLAQMNVNYGVVQIATMNQM